MTNKEVKDFFVSRGASPDFKIVNTPRFELTELILDGDNFKCLTKSISVETTVLI